MKPDNFKRLIQLKLLLHKAIEDCKKPEPFCAAGFSALHDCVEIFNTIVLSEKVPNKSSEKLKFMQYWDEIPNLNYPQEMLRFNKARVGFKHYGVMPNRTEIDNAVANTKSYVGETSKSHLTLDFEELNVYQLIRNKKAVDEMEESERQAALDDFLNANIHLAQAFDILLSEYSSTKDFAFKNPFDTGRDLGFSSAFFLDLEGDKFGRSWDTIVDTVEAIQEKVKILSFGLDYKKYVRFQYLTPIVRRISENDFVTQIPTYMQNISKDDFEFCRSFVIETALALAEFDFIIKPRLYLSRVDPADRMNPLHTYYIEAKEPVTGIIINSPTQIEISSHEENPDWEFSDEGKHVKFTIGAALGLTKDYELVFTVHTISGYEFGFRESVGLSPTPQDSPIFPYIKEPEDK